MSSLLAIAFAVVLFVIPLLTTPISAVASTGFVGLLLAVVAIVACWRWLATAAACVFLADYAAALWIAAMPVNVAGAAGFGLGVLLLLQSVDLACRVRGATVEASVILSEIGRWIGLGVGVLVAAVLAWALANSLAAMLPPVASPLLAAAGSLGTVLILAVLIVRATRSRPRVASIGATPTEPP
jgi:hypothetical protein